MAVRSLIVDDNAQFAAVSRTTLEGSELTIVGLAATGAEALQRTEELRPELVLLDIDLGEESGLDVARRIADRDTEDRPEIILISAHPAEDFVELVAESPALGFIAKSDLSSGAVMALLRAAGRP